MAVSGALYQQQYLAHLVLARLRRRSGMPHLALNITRALGSRATRPWATWTAWEATLAGDRTERTGCSQDAATEDPIALRVAIRAALAGDRAAFDAGMRRAFESVAGVGFLARELGELSVAIDPDTEPGARDWACSDDAPFPPGLLGVHDEAKSLHPVAVLVAPDRAPRRCLLAARRLAGAGSPLHRSSKATSTCESMRSCRVGARRRPTSRRRFLRAPLRLPVRRGSSRNLLGVLVHRARERVGGAGVLVRGGGTLELTSASPVWISDPRSTPPEADQVLHAIARGGESGAKDLAERLGIPLRSVQAAIARLVDDGVCRRIKKGRVVTYRVADTTFTEPSGRAFGPDEFSSTG